MSRWKDVTYCGSLVAAESVKGMKEREWPEWLFRVIQRDGAFVIQGKKRGRLS